jgi:hypothetical protein
MKGDFMFTRLLCLGFVSVCLLGFPSNRSVGADESIMESFQEIVVPVDALELKPRVKRISVDSLIEIFTHKTNVWIDGSPIVVIEFPENSIEHKLFVIQNLAMTPYQYKTRKERYLYRGRAIPPITVRTQQEMYIKLLSTNNSIGYIKEKLLYKDEKNIYVVEVVY